MKIKKIYIAEDNTEFETKEECEEYENKLQKAYFYTILDGKWSKLDCISFYDCGYIIYIPKEVDIETIVNFLQDWGIETNGLDGEGLYLYSDDDGKYRRINDRIKDLQTKEKEYMEELNELIRNETNDL